MFRITDDPLSGSLVQCLAKNYKKDLNLHLTLMTINTEPL